LLPSQLLTVEVLQRPLEPSLDPAVAVMHQGVQAGVLAGPDRHLQSVQRQAGAQGGRDPPADDGAAVGVDDERGVAKPRPGGHIGQVRDPQAVGGRGGEVTADQVGRTVGGLCGRGGGSLAAADDPADAELAHEPGDSVAADLDAFAPELPPDLLGAIHPIVGVPDPADLDLELGVADRAG
jgi:hypothetical protein